MDNGQLSMDNGQWTMKMHNTHQTMCTQPPLHISQQRKQEDLGERNNLFDANCLMFPPLSIVHCPLSIVIVHCPLSIVNCQLPSYPNSRKVSPLLRQSLRTFTQSVNS
ncbi:MAG: hypothetical protein LBB49_03155, partial [Gracilibacteraceae bacterium]|nr:hypothetical protein [Gracilibacteraceae bacterium]